MAYIANLKFSTYHWRLRFSKSESSMREADFERVLGAIDRQIGPSSETPREFIERVRKSFREAGFVEIRA